MDIDYLLLDKQIQNLPNDLFEKIRRLSYKTIDNILLEDIVSYYETKESLKVIQEYQRLSKEYIMGTIKYLDKDNKVVIPYKYSTSIDIFSRHYKYNKYKTFRIIEVIQGSKKFGIYWGLMNNSERNNIIKFLSELSYLY